MAATQLPTKSLILKLLTRDETLAMVDAMCPEDRAQVSDDWFAALRASDSVDPWRHGYDLVHRDTSCTVGKCAFKGPLANGVVEIAYGVDPEHQNKGYATEAADALTNFAFAQNVRTVIAHTLPEESASTHVLTKCSFRHVGEVIDPEDGLVWRWEKHSDTVAPSP